MADQSDFQKETQKLFHLLMFTFSVIGIVFCVLIYYNIDPSFSAFKEDTRNFTVLSIEEDEDRIENGIHVSTGFVEAEGLMEVVNNCTNCHSSKLVIQNRMNTERWNATIKWMQETQNLWDLGGNQEIIVNYLVTNYPAQEVGRRAGLTNIDWYELEE